MLQKTVEISRLLKGFVLFNIVILLPSIFIFIILLGLQDIIPYTFLDLFVTYKEILYRVILLQFIYLIPVIGLAKVLDGIFHKNKGMNQNIHWEFILGSCTVPAIMLLLISFHNAGFSTFKYIISVLFFFAIIPFGYIIILNILSFIWKKNKK